MLNGTLDELHDADRAIAADYPTWQGFLFLANRYRPLPAPTRVVLAGDRRVLHVHFLDMSLRFYRDSDDRDCLLVHWGRMSRMFRPSHFNEAAATVAVILNPDRVPA